MTAWGINTEEQFRVFVLALRQLEQADLDAAKRIMNEVSGFETDWWGRHG